MRLLLYCTLVCLQINALFMKWKNIQRERERENKGIRFDKARPFTHEDANLINLIKFKRSMHTSDAQHQQQLFRMLAIRSTVK